MGRRLLNGGAEILGCQSPESAANCCAKLDDNDYVYVHLNHHERERVHEGGQKWRNPSLERIS